MEDNDKLIEEFSNLWKMFLSFSNQYRTMEEFPRIERLNTMEISIISIVYDREDIILKEICNMLDIPKSTLTSAIDRLERLNYVNRTISKRDRRSYGLQLTDEGEEVKNEHLAFERKLYGYVLNALDTNDEREEFLKLFRKIVNNI
ncbi:MarR family winged helix-turn-helix transcriptional regulator [Clostridium sp. UBA7503]|uniref:MarR family winged helix-turn-helix transcriptional regulator n=1 Tax=Clostridium sp. UBA7503 TaxID=1946377 RepID=UPI0032172B19